MRGLCRQRYQQKLGRRTCLMHDLEPGKPTIGEGTHLIRAANQQRDRHVRRARSVRESIDTLDARRSKLGLMPEPPPRTRTAPSTDPEPVPTGIGPPFHESCPMATKAYRCLWRPLLVRSGQSTEFLAPEASMDFAFCYHCGCRLAAGAIAFIFPTDTERAPCRPDRYCRCSEIVDRWSGGRYGCRRSAVATATVSPPPFNEVDADRA